MQIPSLENRLTKVNKYDVQIIDIQNNENS